MSSNPVAKVERFMCAIMRKGGMVFWLLVWTLTEKRERAGAADRSKSLKLTGFDLNSATR